MRAPESQVNTDTALAEIAWLSANNPHQVYHSLMHQINVDSLSRCYDRLDGRKAVGVDLVNKAMYGENLSANLEDLGSVDNSSSEGLRPATCSRDPEILLNAQHDCTEIDRAGSREQVAGRRDSNCQQPLIARMKRMAYRPGPVREVRIPKEGKSGATRPLGISNFEDKLVQKRIQDILESIYEPLFFDFSYGFRPKRSCHDAVIDLREHLFRLVRKETPTTNCKDSTPILLIDKVQTCNEIVLSPLP